MAASMTLTTAAAVKEWLNINGTGDDARIASLLGYASETIERFCRRSFLQAVLTESHDGEGKGWVEVNCPPIAGTPLVYDKGDDYTLDTTEHLIDAQDLATYANEGRIVYRDDFFEDEEQNVVIQYTGGYAALCTASAFPSDVLMAANVLVAGWLMRGKQGAAGIQTERLGDYSVTYQELAGSMPPECKALLDPFVLPHRDSL